MFSIAQNLTINFLTLLSVNTQVADPASIQVGQVINVPLLPVLSCKAVVNVQSGDNLSAIAASNGVALNDLLEVNTGIINPDMIYPGDVVNIPPCTSAAAAIQNTIKLARSQCKSQTYTAKIGDFASM